MRKVELAWLHFVPLVIDEKSLQSEQGESAPLAHRAAVNDARMDPTEAQAMSISRKTPGYSPAAARASDVLPVPGWPNSSTPLGGATRPGRERYGCDKWGRSLHHTLLNDPPRERETTFVTSDRPASYRVGLK